MKTALKNPLIISFLLLFSTTILSAQTCWQKNLYDVPVGKYIIVNNIEVYGNNHGIHLVTGTLFNNRNRIYQLDFNGNVIFSSPPMEIPPKSFSPTHDGGFAIGNLVETTDTHFASPTNYTIREEFTLRKYGIGNAPNPIEWEFTFPGNDHFWNYFFTKTLDDNSIIAAARGCEFSPTCYHTSESSWLIRLDEQGNILMIDNYPLHAIYDIVELANGDFIFAASNHGEFELRQIDSTGQAVWTESYGNLGLSVWNSSNVSLHLTTNNEILLKAGEQILRTDLNGNLIWSETIDVAAIQPIQNGGFVAVKSAPNPDLAGISSASKVAVLTYNQDAVLINSMYYPDTLNTGTLGSPSINYIPKDIKLMNNNFYAISGYTSGHPFPSYKTSFIMYIEIDETCQQPIETHNEDPGCDFLDAGNVHAGFCTNGIQFSSFTGSGYSSPVNDSAKFFTAQSFILGAKDELTDQLYATYDLRGQNRGGLYAGIVDTNHMNFEIENHWRKVWVVSHQDVKSHIEDFLDNGVIDNPNPAIFDWPGKGNIHAKGRNGVSIYVGKDAAPFVDLNGNGIYEPHLGEYPAIKGCQMAWLSYHDYFLKHMQGNDDFFMGEIQISAYAFSDSTEPELYNSILAEYKVTNYSGRNYVDFYVGNFVDFEMGCFTNNFIGSDPDNNTFYSYVANEIDHSCPTLGFGENPPLQTVSFLNDSMKSFVAKLTNFNPISGIPVNSEHIYNYISGVWKDGSDITYGGDGIGGTQPYPFLYDGNPADSLAWSECSENNTAGNRQVFGSTGPFTLPADSSRTFKFMYTTHHGENLSECVDYDALVKPSVEYVLANYEQIYDCSHEGALPEIPEEMIVYPSVEESPEFQAQMLLYPNPADNKVYLETKNIELPAKVSLIDLTGRELLQFELTQENYEIDISALSIGVYYVILNNCKMSKTKTLLISSAK